MEQKRLDKDEFEWIRYYDEYPGRFEEDYETWKAYVADMADIQHMLLEIRHAKGAQQIALNTFATCPDQQSYLWEYNGNHRYIADRYYEIARILDDFDEKYPAHMATLGDNLDNMYTNLLGMTHKQCEDIILKWEAPKV